MDRLTLFETFLRVVEAGTISSAARQLGCSLSAASRRIDELEAQLGAQLLDRSSRALRVTPAGQRLVPHATALVRAMEDAREAVSQEDASDSLVRLSVPGPLGLTMVVPALSKLLSKTPMLRVEVLLDNELVSLERQGVDVVVRAGFARLPESNELVARSLGSYGFVLCASPSFLKRHGTPARPEDLASTPTIAHVGIRGKSIPFRRDGHEVAVMLRPVVWTNDMRAAQSAAQGGVGIAGLPDWLVEDDLARDVLRAVLPEWQAPSGEAWVAYRRRGPNRAAVRTVVTYLVANLRLKRAGTNR